MPLTDEDRRVLKTAAYGAVFMVSSAEPGFFSMLKESFAASGALSGSTGLVREVLIGGEQPRVPRGPREAVEAAVLPALSRSMEILREESPADAESFRATVLSAVRRVAAATRGVQPAEAEAIARIEAALAAP